MAVRGRRKAHDDLKDANETLLVAAIREQDNADRATQLAAALEASLRREALLSRISLALTSTLEGDVLAGVPRLLVPTFADWCAVEAVADNGTLKQVATAHVTTVTASAAPRTAAQIDQQLTGGSIHATVLATGEGMLRNDPTDHAATAEQTDDRIYSCLCVPILVRGEVFALLWATTSVSARELGAVDKDFAEQVAVRAALALDNARLYEEARLASRMRDDIIATVSHDLGGLVAGIKLRTQAVLSRSKPVLPDAIANAFRRISDAAERMTSLVVDLSELANVHTGRLVLRQETVDARTLVKKSRDMAEPLASAKSLQLTCDLPDMPLPVHCDPERVFRVLGNLIGNAVKFTPAGRGIHISARRRDRDVVIVVSDEGPGIDESELGEIFQPYRRGRGAGAPGKGLGLYIARALVEAHASTLTVESTPGDGSTFSFALPVAGNATAHPIGTGSA